MSEEKITPDEARRFIVQEIVRLRRVRDDLLRALTPLVAYERRLYSEPTDDHGPYCVFCDRYTDEDDIGTEREEHEEDCPVLVARATMGREKATDAR